MTDDETSMRNTWRQAEADARAEYREIVGHDYDPDTIILFFDKHGIPTSSQTLYFQLHARHLCAASPEFAKEYMKQKKEMEHTLFFGRKETT